jgi:hypothetical protein
MAKLRFLCAVPIVVSQASATFVLHNVQLERGRCDIADDDSSVPSCMWIVQSWWFSTSALALDAMHQNEPWIPPQPPFRSRLSVSMVFAAVWSCPRICSEVGVKI